MQRLTQLFIFFLVFQLTAIGQTDLENRLFDLPDVRFKPIEAPTGYSAAYELMIKQPIDHQNPEKGYFYQRAFLSHMDYEQPTVLITEGYERPRNRMYELTEYLGANQIDVEHRYFGQSVPENLDYTYLNLEQATADLHKVRELFGQIYEEGWISSGISKGGQTTIFYRYFYPDDVDVSVPYVAPLNLDLADPRIYDFLANVGTPECRKALYDFQVRLLKERATLLPLLRWHAKGAGLQFNYFTLEQAFEYAVLEYPFSFWQMGHDCADIPGVGADTEALLDHFNKVVGLGFYSDAETDAYASHYYQALTQMGYYGFDTQAFKGLLKTLPEKPHAAFAPDKMDTDFDPRLIRSVAKWLAEEGDNFIYLYGATDTWSATAVPPSDKTNSLWFMMPGRDHGSARIKNLSEAERKKLFNQIETWLEMPVGVGRGN